MARQTKTQHDGFEMRGLDLNERYYREVVRPIFDAHFPGLPHAAALIGWGSEVLGFDDDTSTDHNWGLRFTLFLTADENAEGIDSRLAEDLPHEFLGFPTAFAYHVNDDQGGARDVPRHNINITTVSGYFEKYLGLNPNRDITPTDWLTLPRHKLCGITSGRVFHDGFGELESARENLRWYPRDVWLYMLAAQWLSVFEEQAFIGRCRQVGDDTGAALIAARQVENLMNLCFLIERVYAPYSKWFGTAFSRLECADDLGPLFADVVGDRNIEKKEQKLADAYKTVILLFNSLGIVDPMSDEVALYYSRPMLTIQDESVVEKLLAAITDDRVRNIDHNFGSVNQAFRSSDKLNDAELTKRLKSLY